MTDSFPRCPVCLDAIAEPVTLPCRHEICVDCFKKTLEMAALCCPLCRKRMSSWARRNAKDPVNKSRKAEIEREQQEKAQDWVHPSGFQPDLSQPGDIRREYLLELQQIENERKKDTEKNEHEAEQLQQEEMHLLQQLLTERESQEVEDQKMADTVLAEELELEQKLQEQLREDEAVARKLCEEYQQAQKHVTSPRQNFSKKKKQMKNPQLTLHVGRTGKTLSKPLTHWFKPINGSTP